MNVNDLILTHAKQEYPKECCGVVVMKNRRKHYVACRNVAERPGEHFIIHPEDMVYAEEWGRVISIVHSHCKTPPEPSESDKVGIEQSGIPWIIVNPLTGEIKEHKPSGYKAPLIGREFRHGVQDCYSIIQDYYSDLGIKLRDFDRPERWWLKGLDLYDIGFPLAGFSVVNDGPKEHDILLMKVASPVINHGAIMLGNGHILHHLTDRLSSEDVYGGWFRKVTVKIIRHEAFL